MGVPAWEEGEEEADFLDCKCVGWESRRESEESFPF